MTVWRGELGTLVYGEAVCLVVFFFSSRRRHTRFDCDWSSDVCSSDLEGASHPRAQGVVRTSGAVLQSEPIADGQAVEFRSEERRVGKECRSRWSPYH